MASGPPMLGHRRSSMVMKPRRSGAAVEGIALLKSGALAWKFDDREKPHLRKFKLDDDETCLTWEGTVLGKFMRAKLPRCVMLDDVLELQVGEPLSVGEDLLKIERTQAFDRGSNASRESRMSARPSSAFPCRPGALTAAGAGGGFGGGGGTMASKPDGASGQHGVFSKMSKALQHAPAAPIDVSQTHLKLTLRLIGSLPAPPTEDGLEPAEKDKPRESLQLQSIDEEALGMWLAALRTLLNERKPPSPIGPEALMGSFGAPLDEVALADASIEQGLLVPAVLEALWLAIYGRPHDDALGTEGLFRLSAAGSEMGEMRRRLQEGEDVEEALKGCTTIGLAALIKLYLRELPGQLWLPVRAQLLSLVEGPSGVDVSDGGGGGGGGGRAKVVPIASSPAASSGGGGSSGSGGNFFEQEDEAEPLAEEDREKVCLKRGLRALVATLPRRSADVIIWTCDVMAAVVEHESDNRMGPTAICAVLAPVLMRGLAPEDAEAASDPLGALRAAQHSTKLAEALLAAHRESRLTRGAPSNASVT